MVWQGLDPLSGAFFFFAFRTVVGDFRLSLLQSSLRRFFRGVDHSGRIGLLAPITGGVRERQAVRGRPAMCAW